MEIAIIIFLVMLVVSYFVNIFKFLFRSFGQSPALIFLRLIGIFVIPIGILIGFVQFDEGY